MNFNFINKDLDKRKKDNSFRINQSIGKRMVDFASNDYLGLLKNQKEVSICTSKSGSGASRLISGDYDEISSFEIELAKYHNSESSLFFNSGYTANIGLFSALGKRGVTFILDEQIHASIKDGIRLGFGKQIKFSHNNLLDLEKKLTLATGDKFIVVESVYSMSGSISPLEDIVSLAKKFNAKIIVDEAHAIGIFGSKGEGIVSTLNLEAEIYVRILAYGKAYGAQGGALLLNKTLRDYLINFSRPYIYSTAPSPILVKNLINNYEIVKSLNTERSLLKENINIFNRDFNLKNKRVLNESPIKFIKVGGNQKSKEVCKFLSDSNIYCIPILSPTVKKGSEGIRVVLHSFNTESEILKLKNKLGEIYEKF